MRPTVVIAAAALGVVEFGAPLAAQDTLRVLRHAPGDSASPSSTVTVMFDRPVAAALDSSVAAARVFSVAPAMRGSLSWRDPITIRFIPDAPLEPGIRYTVTIDTSIRGADGARLGAPYRFEFRVAGPTLLERSFGLYRHADTLPPDGRLQLMYSAPVSLERLSRGARLETSPCPGAKTIPLRATGQHRVGASDLQVFRNQRTYPADTIAERFHTVVDLEPAEIPPVDCAAFVVLPTTDDDARFGREERYVVRTAPAFRVAGTDCVGADEDCIDALTLRFSSRVRREDVLKYVRVNGEPIGLRGGTPFSMVWHPNAYLVTRSTYTIQVDSSLRDIHGRALEGERAWPVRVDDYLPRIQQSTGVVTVPRSGPPTMPLRSVNVESVRIIAYRVPDSLRLSTMSSAGSIGDPSGLRGLKAETTFVLLPDELNADTTVDIPLPPAALAPDHPLVLARVSIAAPLPDIIPHSATIQRHAMVLGGSLTWETLHPENAIIQRTDLAVSGRLVGEADGSAFVTGLADGRPRANVVVTQYDRWRRAVGRGTTDDRGIARLVRIALDSVLPPRTPVASMYEPRFTLLEAKTSGDRVAVALGGLALGYRPESPLDVSNLGGRREDMPWAAGGIFTDRGIYRPGETVHFKGVVRRGMLGSLTIPRSTDSARIVVRRVNDAWTYGETTFVARDTVKRLSRFGTLVDSLALRSGLRLGRYTASVQIAAPSGWRTLQSTEFQLEEYRPPAFLVDASEDTTVRYRGDTIVVGAQARFLFGAPLRGGQVKWSARFYSGLQPRPRHIGDDWTLGSSWSWSGASSRTDTLISGVGTLDSNGTTPIHIPVNTFTKRASGSVDVTMGVTDLDQQALTANTSATVSASRVYILARTPRGVKWRLGTPGRIDVRTVNENGERVSNVAIRAVTLRRHPKAADPSKGHDGTFVVDTIADRVVQLTGGTGSLSFAPDSASEYEIVLSASDADGGVASTVLQWNFTQPVLVEQTARTMAAAFRLPLMIDSTLHAVGDIARVRFNSPFHDAEAWITVEREGVIEQRRERVAAGSNVVEVAVTSRFVPNAFVSVLLVARGEPSRPDSASQRMRAGYVELYVKANRKDLSVALATDRRSYSPRDTATIRVHVRDNAGRGVHSELALWAVDEGVLALTGFQTPDLRPQMYRPRGIGADLWSTIPTIITSDPGLAAARLRQAALMLNRAMFGSHASNSVATISTSTVRSRFASTAFYLGHIETDSRGDAVARAPVPDNLTTFRVMAVAVSADDRYGRGDTTLLVTRPLVARAALPRFVRPTDSLVAGVVVTAQHGRARAATADASVEGARLLGPARVNVALTATASSEARFVIQAPPRNAIGDTVAVQLGAADGVNADATLTTLPVRPDFHQRTHAVLGAVRNSETITLTLPPEIDPARSRMRLRVGTSRVSAMLAAYWSLRAYPFDYSEQLTSIGRTIIAVWRTTRRERSDALGGDPHAKLQELADEIARRQSTDGSIRYWPTSPWSTPWLSSYAGMFLLEARDEGVIVDPQIIAGIARYLTDASRARVDSGGINRFEQRDRRFELGDRVAVVDFLRRFGRPDTATEQSLSNVARAMTWEDRLRLAEVVAQRRDMRARAESLVDDAWRAVISAGHRADLPDSANGPREFPSRIAPAARLLSASLMLRPNHPLLGALAETVLQQGRTESGLAWNTQDYASVVMALVHFNEGEPVGRIVTANAGSRHFVARPASGDVDTTITAPLDGMLETMPNGDRVLRVHVDASQGDRPVYYALEVDEVPLAAPIKPDIHGIVVERWYERFDNGAPVTRVKEGDLVRVRLRVSVPADRQFVAVEDPLPAGLEPIDIGLRTNDLAAFSSAESEQASQAGNRDRDGPVWQMWLYGSWDDGHWSPWEYKELHDDRVSYFARALWTGSYTASYVARATTAGSFVAPPAYAEEMYNPALQGRSSGGRFEISVRP